LVLPFSFSTFPRFSLQRFGGICFLVAISLLAVEGLFMDFPDLFSKLLPRLDF